MGLGVLFSNTGLCRDYYSGIGGLELLSNSYGFVRCQKPPVRDWYGEPKKKRGSHTSNIV